MIIDDDRTAEQRKTHTWLVVGTDRGMSGWGKAENGVSYAAWACDPDRRNDCLCWVERRKDMTRVREVSEFEAPYRPRAKGHLHIYVWPR